MKYKIEVHSSGYEDTFKIVDCPSMSVAKQTFNVNAAIIEWAEHNALDLDADQFHMPFTRVSKVKDSEP